MTTTRSFAAALFDMDGTLIDSTPAVDRSWTRWGEEWQMDPSFRVGMHGRPARQIIEALVPPEQVEEAFERVEQLELADVDDILVLDGATELLAALPDERRAIVTSCTRRLAAARIAGSGIPAPRTVVTIDDTSRGKPHPDPFLEGARRLGVDPHDCVVFEDAPAGLAAAKSAGCFTVAVVGTHTRAELDADLVVDRLSEVVVTLTAQGFTLTAP
ncbi:HAD-IA family hydrolase [Subtercola endophyticus]|uniref:HAD-IA family hydrolase n=1 Tax=Subtercola endophyticus TaxID=2895559 RepID=UPI001E3611A0|nr:HAD-IA family hydrolase [Subtercola endophyticus]UFS58236.1 HAD-IA family hydrolase [Subtercola endophyticus]